MKKYLSILSFCLLLVVMLNCVTTMVPKVKDKPDCSSSLEGFFHSPGLWTGKVPALILKENIDIIKFGKIISIENDGVIFDADKESPFHDPEAKLYSFTDIKMLIDEKRNLVYGEIPPKYAITWTVDILFSNMNTPKQKPLEMLLKPNQPFSYCVPAGKYLIRGMIFTDKYNNIDIGTNMPYVIFEVKPNQANYLGDIYININNINEENTLLIPYTIFKRNSQVASGAALGGPIGYEIHGIINEAKGIVGAHSLTFIRNNDFTPELNMPVNTCEIKVAKH